MSRRLMRLPWPSQELPEPMFFTVNTEPPGATVLLDGEKLAQVSPVNVELLPGQTYDLEIQLEGHHTRRQEGLVPEEQERQVLTYELERVPPPGKIAVRASYPVSLLVGGSAVSGTPTLEAGSYQIELRAPSVFHRETRRIQVQAGKTSTVELPATTSVRVMAVPANATVTIDGQTSRAIEAPDEIDLIDGSQHTFRFEWPDGSAKERRLTVDTSVRQIVGSSVEIETRG